MTSNLLTAAIATLTAREYRRVSLDRSGRARSVDEQGDDNARARERHGIALGGAPYVDNDRSASRYARKTRDDFARLLADLENGTFGAGVLQLWESSRGSRKVGEWVTLIELCEERGIKIFVTTHERIYDPANERDRRTLLEDAVDSEYESGKVSKRTARTAAAEAAKGRPAGVAPHGYRPEYDQRTGRLLNWVENPEESAVPRELFRRLRAGESLGSITRALAAAGHVNRSGKPFTQQHLRTMATRHAYAGLRAHQPVKKVDRKKQPMTVTDAVWAPLVDRETWYDVQRLISDPSRKTSRNGRAKHEITMIIKCDVCGGPLNSRTEKRGKRLIYTCLKNSCVRIDRQGVDEIVIGKMLGYLALPDLYEVLAAPSADDARVQKIRADLAEARASISEMESETPESVAMARVLARSIEALAEKIAGLEAQERELTMPSALAGILAPGTDVAEWWTDAPISARREVAKIILTPGLLGEVRVKRAVRRNGQTPAAERIVWQQAA